MSHNSEEVQSKLGEKKQLQKEEEALKKLIEQIQRQISALQVGSFFILFLESNTFIPSG